jgi:hypothetical protein
MITCLEITDILKNENPELFLGDSVKFKDKSVIGEWQKLQNKELHNLFSVPNII